MLKVKKTISAAFAVIFFIIAMSAQILSVNGSETYTASTDDSRFSYYVKADGTLKIKANGGASFSGELKIPSKLDSKTVSAVAERGFIGQNLMTSLVLPESVSGIGESAFANCNALESVKVNGTITDIGLYPFFATPFEKNLETDGDFVLFNGDILYDYTGTSEKIVIPDGVRVISGNLFTYSETQLNFEIHNVIFPKSVEYICSRAFYDCNNLQSITLDTGVKSIGESAFTASGMTVIGYFETYAQDYAVDNGFVFQGIIPYGSISETCYVRYDKDYRQHYFSDEDEFDREGVFVYRINYNGDEIEVDDWVYSKTPAEVYGE